MNLRSIDLNLLTILDALLDEAHVSRAAVRTGLSQPAASAALERCRHLFRDPLLERAKGGMRRTTKAEALRAPLKTLLADAERLIDPPETPLTDLRRRIRLVLADLPPEAFLTPLLRAMRHGAPGLDLIVAPWRGADRAREALEKGEADLALSVFPERMEAIETRTLFDERYLAAMRADHPAATDFTLERWLAYPHLVVSGSGEPRSPVDTILAERGLSRRVGVTVTSFVAAPSLLRGSDLIGLTPSRCLVGEARRGLAVLEPPIPIEGFPLRLAWHERSSGDMAIRYIAERAAEILEPIDA